MLGHNGGADAGKIIGRLSIRVATIAKAPVAWAAQPGPREAETRR
jgi:hypothetical protein